MRSGANIKHMAISSAKDPRKIPEAGIFLDLFNATAFPINGQN